MIPVPAGAANADVEAPAQASETAAILSMIERAARDPNVDVDRMMRLMEMRDSMLDREARVSFAGALADMQPELPVINRHGRIEVRDKNTPSRVTQSTSFATWEDINDAIKPILHDHGFSLSFRTGTANDGKIEITAVLRHRAGYEEQTTLALPHDSTGSKNAVQAVGSSTSYGKRYTAMALLNITSRAEMERDDDGRRAGAPSVISDAQVRELHDLIRNIGANEARFLRHFKIQALEDLPANRFAEARRALKDKENGK